MFSTHFMNSEKYKNTQGIHVFNMFIRFIFFVIIYAIQPLSEFRVFINYQQFF